MLPLAFTAPTPVMVTLVAFCARQVSTTGLPGLGLLGGFAVKDVITGAGGGGGAVTVTVAVAVTVPKLFVAVKVYVAVCVGWTSCVPTSATWPTLGEMLVVVAFSTCQTNVEVPPDTMLGDPPRSE